MTVGLFISPSLGASAGVFLFERLVFNEAVMVGKKASQPYKPFNPMVYR